jgi:hypothetical protein
MSNKDVTEFPRNKRKTGQKGRKTPHSTWKNIIFCHFRSNPEGFIFSEIELIGGLSSERRKNHILGQSKTTCIFFIASYKTKVVYACLHQVQSMKWLIN